MLHSAYLPATIPNYPLGRHALQREVEHFHASQDKIRIVPSWYKYKGLSVAHRVDESYAAKILPEHGKKKRKGKLTRQAPVASLFL